MQHATSLHSDPHGQQLTSSILLKNVRAKHEEVGVLKCLSAAFDVLGYLLDLCESQCGLTCAMQHDGLECLRDIWEVVRPAKDGKSDQDRAPRDHHEASQLQRSLARKHAPGLWGCMA